METAKMNSSLNIHTQACKWFWITLSLCAFPSHHSQQQQKRTVALYKLITMPVTPSSSYFTLLFCKYNFKTTFSHFLGEFLKIFFDYFSLVICCRKFFDIFSLSPCFLSSDAYTIIAFLTNNNNTCE